MRTINEINNEMSECKEQAEKLKKRIQELGLEKAEAELSDKFPIGRDILIGENKYRITGYGHDFLSRVLVCKYNKDGNISKREQILWDSDIRNAVLIDP